jgi:hypothetical protein
MDNNPISNSLYSHGYVSTNILQERVNLRCAYSWFGMNLPNHHFNDGTKKKEMSAMKNTHS